MCFTLINDWSKQAEQNKFLKPEFYELAFERWRDFSRQKFVLQYFKKLRWFNQSIIFKLREIILAIYNILF